MEEYRWAKEKDKIDRDEYRSIYGDVLKGQTFRLGQFGAWVDAYMDEEVKQPVWEKENKLEEDILAAMELQR